jgi:branched-chain amino acid transport system permease protein
MDAIAQSISNGLVIGLIYVLIASGLTLVFGIMRIVQFAHGEIYMLGAYCVYFLYVTLGLNVFLSFVIAAVSLGVVGIVIERFLYRRFRGNIETSIIVAIGLIILLQTIATVSFGTQERSIPNIIPGIVSLGGIRLSWDRALAVIVGAVLTISLFIFVRRTRTGRAMVAVSQDVDGAALQGVNVNRIASISMAVGCALAAIAGGMMGAILKINADMGGFAMAQGIAVIILGGLGSIPGAVIGGLVLGLVDGVVPFFADTNIASITGFALIIVMLFIRPRGLLGRG